MAYCMKAKQIDIPNIKEILDYDEDSGLFRWKHNMNGRSKKCCAGTIAGTKINSGYIQISIFNIRYLAHRLAWFYVHGSIDQNLVIDHINRIRDDNRIENLRLVDPYENALNKSVQKRSSSGHTGIIWNKSKNKWQVSITINGKRFNCGNFSNFDNAVAARKDAYIRNAQRA